MESATPPQAPPTQQGTININIGVLGHVDCGKTSLVRALSTKFSTASLDKSPESMRRGITLDLGFSAFDMEAPEGLASLNYSKVQYTLVDCPGHASLIRTIIGGAQIIDRMILVVDVTKGIQTQTAECLVIGEILTDDLVVVLNKMDLLPANEREAKLKVIKAKIEKVLASTRFKKCPLLAVSAIVGGDGKGSSGAGNITEKDGIETMGLDNLIKFLHETTFMPKRGDVDGVPLYFAIDHCFPIKGQGTVLTGTIMEGSLKVGQVVEIPQLKAERKIKSMQMFREPVQKATKGDRVAVCVTNLNAKSIERGVLSSPGSVPAIKGVIALVRKVKYFPLKCKSGSKIHMTVGHSTTLATVTFFGSQEVNAIAKANVGKDIPVIDFDQSMEYEYDEELMGGGKKLDGSKGPTLHYALLQFDNPVICQEGAMLLGSRLDLDIDTKVCRIAFYGRTLVRHIKALDADALSELKVYRRKHRTGTVDRIVDKGSPPYHNVIGKGLFSSDSALEKCMGKKIRKDGETGVIESPFGKSGKFKVFFPNGVDTIKGDRLVFEYKKMVFGTSDENKKLPQ